MEERRGGSAVSYTQASIDHLSVRTLALNAYYDFPDALGGISPYLGGGLGPAFAEVSGVRFSNELSDTILAVHLYAGADYSLNDKTLLGLKLPIR